MDHLRVGLLSFIDDPFDPPGHERYGGGHLFLFDLGRLLVQHGYYVVFFTRQNSPDKAPIDRLGPLCSIYRLNVGVLNDVPTAVAGEYLEEMCSVFQSLLRAEGLRFDAMHSNHWMAGEAVRRIDRRHTFRHVHSVLSLGRLYHERGGPLPETATLRDACEVRVFNSADALLTVCPSEYQDLRRLYPEVDLSRTHIIPYGVDPNVFYPRPQSESDFVRRQTIGFQKGVDTPF